MIGATIPEERHSPLIPASYHSLILVMCQSELAPRHWQPLLAKILQLSRDVGQEYAIMPNERNFGRGNTGLENLLVDRRAQ